MARSSRKNLAAVLKDADERVRQAAADALNEAAAELVAQIKENMNAQNITERTGKLRASIKYNEATAKRPNVLLKSEVFAPAPRRPGSRNPRMRGRYKYGTPYGRILEFSPRINKPFFYNAWYKRRREIKENVLKKITEAWSNG